MQGEHEPMGTYIGEEDTFQFNDSITSKFYKVKIGKMVAQKETKAEK